MADDRAFTYDPATDIGRVRLNLTDTRSPGVFSDDEIQVFLDDGGSVNGATIIGLRILLTDAARRTRVFSRSASGESVSYNDTAAITGLQASLEEYRKTGNYPAATVVMPALLPFDRGYDEANP